jgi:O-antigen/teichoic acid export membrane protein
MPPGPSGQLEAREPPLALLAVLGHGFFYLSTVLLVRHLPVDGFDDYVVASAVFMLTATAAPLGSEKYALRALPVYLERKDWARAQGYLRFALRRVTGVSLLLAAAGVAWALWPGATLADSARRSVAVAALAVPVGALLHFGLEALTASGHKVAALAAYWGLHGLRGAPRSARDLTEHSYLDSSRKQILALTVPA